MHYRTSNVARNIKYVKENNVIKLNQVNFELRIVHGTICYGLPSFYFECKVAE